MARYLVDGMNVIGSRPDGWWKDREGAMARLVESLERHARGSDVEIAVVFERAPREPLGTGAVEVLHAPVAGRDAADDEIVRLLEAEQAPGAVTVVTSDRELAARVRATGAAVEPAHAFRSRIE